MVHAFERRQFVVKKTQFPMKSMERNRGVSFPPFEARHESMTPAFPTFFRNIKMLHEVQGRH